MHFLLAYLEVRKILRGRGGSIVRVAKERGIPSAVLTSKRAFGKSGESSKGNWVEGEGNFVRRRISGSCAAGNAEGRIAKTVNRRQKLRTVKSKKYSKKF